MYETNEENMKRLRIGKTEPKHSLTWCCSSGGDKLKTRKRVILK